ncbi:peptidase M24 family protein [Dictyostelium discoideum AX4]|uniref:Xaa-Pro aminopeptidase 1 n=1 Tax=Dictyostelium discoideum TaxID=44689 RepID=XPP1_DICDI|nr:peptidase M24 family protein [Dictyostelium discoideum AX4]Q54G06.1 RecName: Full=Xaa-Pro aminopeptidase 1; AltName: Full=Aminoacylproline aminopeptidase; AltName: Full=Cytosolic aminopeptidase P; AltName: Full=Soluble aminopeptidase P; Short=sAmp; AltName: Full=X-Pro aminopeptidase 1; AltName: Full=X-prolyl aminopeptidase 1, soluble [Dictyostelium discoideum]EAL62111.1 peptidase M24 family protein [Dictyostelium discoideum AX4]|eukprot:XP_635611.1 peptidase M24 family protein [Dictyostelium discoideum AX4]
MQRVLNKIISKDTINTMGKVAISKKVEKLRTFMKDQSLSAYIVPSEDAHQSEYICVKDKRREYISGFSGSAGCVVITLDNQLLWTDGRYWLQAEKELESNWKIMKDRVVGEPTIQDWLLSNLNKENKVGIDSRLISKGYYDSMKLVLKEKSIDIKFDEDGENLIDKVRESFKDEEEIPEYPKNSIFFLEDKFTGKQSNEKLKEIREEMKKQSADLMVVSALDEIAWLLNLRGSDISFNPVFLSYVVVEHEKVTLFVDESKLNDKTKSQLPSGIAISPYSSVFEYLRNSDKQGKKIWIDPRSSVALYNCVSISNLLEKINPILLSKAIKNETEIQGMKNAHIRDAVALIQFLAWMEEEIVEKSDETSHTEYSVCEKLEGFRRQQTDFVSLSFDTISSINANGAIIHYKPDETTSATIVKGMYLVDSGAQYLDGTTDVTRTLHYGKPTQHEIDCYTRVLRGHVGLSLLKFPNRVNGRDIDCVARTHLWSVGLDYAHGTGHGVGSFLNVHEGPQGISYRAIANPTNLQAGMTLTNEPGYYESGNFGIRIENVMIVAPVTTQFNNGKFIGFDNITLVPYERKLINLEMLTKDEINFINDYYKEIGEKILPLIEKTNNQKSINWLKNQIKPL